MSNDLTPKLQTKKRAKSSTGVRVIKQNQKAFLISTDPKQISQYRETYA
jgi:hypothetical protein